ncbi:hypothetical protein B0H14DRAFT_3147019 [Mycena olivaceomarginata]|nr:hypothetical protein B0H14DRAFT_3147019 [Mycena olivaceomarginata]
MADVDMTVRAPASAPGRNKQLTRACGWLLFSLQAQADDSANANADDWVRVTSDDGYSFVVRRRVANASETMRDMLDTVGNYAEAIARTCPVQQRGLIVEKLLEYMSFKAHYERAGPKDEVPVAGVHGPHPARDRVGAALGRRLSEHHEIESKWTVTTSNCKRPRDKLWCRCPKVGLPVFTSAIRCLARNICNFFVVAVPLVLEL